MKNVPLSVLKKNLSNLADEASKGVSIQVTKHNRPYLLLTPVGPAHLCIGTHVGKQNLKPLLKGASRGRWLDFLSEDREER